jgi:hypothetical protein
MKRSRERKKDKPRNLLTSRSSNKGEDRRRRGEEKKRPGRQATRKRFHGVFDIEPQSPKHPQRSRSDHHVILPNITKKEERKEENIYSVINVTHPQPLNSSTSPSIVLHAKTNISLVCSK